MKGTLFTFPLTHGVTGQTKNGLRITAERCSEGAYAFYVEVDGDVHPLDDSQTLWEAADALGTFLETLRWPSPWAPRPAQRKLTRQNKRRKR